MNDSVKKAPTNLEKQEVIQKVNNATERVMEWLPLNKFMIRSFRIVSSRNHFRLFE